MQSALNHLFDSNTHLASTSAKIIWFAQFLFLWSSVPGTYRCSCPYYTSIYLHTHPLKPNTHFPPLVSSPGGTLSGNDVMVNVSGFPLTFHAQHHHNYKDTTHTHASIHVSITSHIIASASLCMSVWTHTIHNTSVHTYMRTEESIILLQNLACGLVVYQHRHIENDCSFYFKLLLAE